MRTYLISYDLAQPARNRHALTSAIMMLGASWARPLEQTWYIKSDLDETDIDSVLHGLIGDDDGLIVQCVRDEALLANTSLRWFKQRKLPLAEAQTNVVTFPVISPPPAYDDEMAPAAQVM